MARHPTDGWNRATLALLSPWLFTFLAFGLFPIAYSLYISFTPYTLLMADYSWIGLENYEAVLRSAFFWQALFTTLIYTAGVIPFVLALSLVAALLVTGPIRLRSFVQASFYLPGIVSIIVIASVFRFIYAADGPLDNLLLLFGLEPPRPSWLLNPRLALGCVVGMSVWASFGFYALLYVAALQMIPRDLYDAASIDGASWWKQLLHITLPQLRPTTTLILILLTIRSMQVFPEVFVLTKGGPLNATTTAVYSLYTIAFEHTEMARGAALSYILFVIILSGVAFWAWLLRSRRGVDE